MHQRRNFINFAVALRPRAKCNQINKLSQVYHHQNIQTRYLHSFKHLASYCSSSSSFSSLNHLDLNSTNKLIGGKHSRRWQSHSQSDDRNNVDQNNTYYPLKPHVDKHLSYVFGRSPDKLLYTTIGKEMEKRVSEGLGADYIAYVSEFEGIEKTLDQFHDDVTRLAAGLIRKFKIKNGDRVGVYSYNCYNWLLIQFACARIGAIIVPINPSYKAEELAFVLESSAANCLFTQGPKSRQCLELNNHFEWLKSSIIRDKLDSGKLENLRDIIVMDGNNQDYPDISCPQSNVWVHKQCTTHHWSDCFNQGRLFATKEQAAEANGQDASNAIILDVDSVSPNDTFAIYYTSGTTGTPKGACVSHFAALNNSLATLKRLMHNQKPGWRPTMSVVLPMFHIFAGVLISFAPILSQTQMIIPSFKYDMKATVDSIIKWKTTVSSVTPTILIDMLRYVQVHKLGHSMPLEIVQSGGASLPPEMVKRAYDTLANLKSIRIGYGSTENAAIATMQSCLEPEETRSISVGSPIDFTEVRIVDLDGTDRLVKLGERGEIQTRGYNMMTGYLNEVEKTKSVITENNWYKTGDVGILHPNGSLQIVGRIKNLIIRGGENIYPDEVERFIYKLPFVDTVHVFGLPDKRVGEQVCAWIKLKPGFSEKDDKKSSSDNEKQVSSEQVIKFCMDNMTYFKVPKYVLFVDSFPMTPTKKVQSHKMAEITLNRLKLASESTKM